MPKVTKAVIAAAGFGTRFLPQTKAMPKEMLPIINKPIIQYIVEDLVAAGIKDIIIVGSTNKRAIEDHFDLPSRDLVGNLEAGGPSKKHYIEELDRISSMANFVYIRQKGPYGTGTPIMNAIHLLGNEPFIYTYADGLIVSEPNSFQRMIGLYEQYNGGVLSCFGINQDKEYSRYGIIGGQEIEHGLIKMDDIVEKPGRDSAPSSLAVGDALLFTPEVFPYLEKGYASVPADKEFYLTDYVIKPMLQDGKDFYGFTIDDAARYDTGDKLEYIKTVIDFSLKDADLGEDIREFLRSKNL